MTWRYQIIKHKNWYGLHEVFLDDGKVKSWTEEPITFVSDVDEGVDGIIKALQMALDDCQNLSALDKSLDD